MNRDRSYLLDIHQYGQDVLEFVAGMSEADFIADLKTQRAVVYCIAVIGEAAKKLSPEFRGQSSHIPWKAIAGMRDKCVHDYRQVNPVRVWQVVQTDVLELLQAIEPFLPIR